MKTSRLLTAFATAALLLGCAPGGQKAEGPYYIDIKDRAQLHEWFRYSPERPVVISGHRGGMVTGFPENCIESFEKTLTMMPSFFEIDPRMTKDSVIVLMHDATIDRTTTGTGKVSDYTYAELQQFFLKDREGNVTTYKIPTLEECIAWSQGKTILNLDIKDVPLEVMSQFINRLAPANVMYTVRNAKQARTYLDRDPQAMFSCWCKNMKEFNEYVGERIPWSQVIPVDMFFSPNSSFARWCKSVRANCGLCFPLAATVPRVRGNPDSFPHGCCRTDQFIFPRQDFRYISDFFFFIQDFQLHFISNQWFNAILPE